MSTRDYVVIAEALREFSQGIGADRPAVRELAGSLVVSFTRDNPRFDRARFLTACGLEG